MRDLNTQWGWSEKGFAGYGQMVVRGIRGQGWTFRLVIQFSSATQIRDQQ